VKSIWSNLSRLSIEVRYLLLDFFLEFVDPLGAALDPFVDLDLLVVALALFVVAALDQFVAADLASFVADDLDPFVLACAACIAKSSCLLEQPVASKIRLIVGEVSSSMVSREEALDPCLVVAVLTVDGRDDRDVVVDRFVGLTVVMIFTELRRAFRSF